MVTNQFFKKFKNIPTTVGDLKHSPIQKRDGDGVMEKAKAGRPKKPNMERINIRVHEAIKNELVMFSKKQQMSNSDVIAKALTYFFKKCKESGHPLYSN